MDWPSHIYRVGSNEAFLKDPPKDVERIVSPLDRQSANEDRVAPPAEIGQPPREFVLSGLHGTRIRMDE